MKELNDLLTDLKATSLISRKKYEALVAKMDTSEYEKEQPKLSWPAVRQLFFGTDENNFEVEPMNSANLCPTFQPVLQAIHDFRLGFNQDISMQKRQQLFGKTMIYTKKALARHFGLKDNSEREGYKNLAIIRNTSEGNNLLSSGFKRWACREVLLWNENHPTNRGAWRLKADICKGNKIVEFDLKGLNLSVEGKKQEARATRAIIKRITDKITPYTTLLSFTEISNVSGIRMPAKEIIKAVRAYERKQYGRTNSEIHIHVDGAVSWGALHHDLCEMDCDSFVSSAHKWFMGPFETGILYMKPERLLDFDINIYAYDGKIAIPDWDRIPKDISRFELLGQRDEANVYALLMAVVQHERINGYNNENGSLKTSRIQQRIKALQNLLIEKLNALARGDYSIAYRTPVSTKFSQGVTIFQLSYKGEPINHVKLQEALYGEVGISGRKRFAVAHTGKDDNHLRICPHIMNLESNIQDIVDAIQDFLERSAKEEVAARGVEETLVGMGWPQHPYV